MEEQSMNRLNVMFLIIAISLFTLSGCSSKGRYAYKDPYDGEYDDRYNYGKRYNREYSHELNYYEWERIGRTNVHPERRDSDFMYERR